MSNKSEKELTEELICSEAETGSILFRNNVGLGYTKTGTPFKYGMGKGSSDQIGYKSIVVTPDLIGKKIAIFQAIEIKTLTDKISCEQIIFYLNILISGGIGQVYTEDRFLTHEEIMKFPRRKEKPEDQAKYEKIISNLSKTLSL